VAPSLLWLLATALLWSGSAQGDVVVFKDGERQEGIVTPAPGESDAILFQQISGQVKISRSRIESIIEEPDEVDLRKVGDLYFTAKRYDNALDFYKKAAAINPDDKLINERVQNAQSEIEAPAQAKRAAEQAKLDKTQDEIDAKIKAKNFEVADVLALKVVESNPSDKQKERLTEQKKRILKGWGMERLDKMQEDEAAKRFEQYLELDPSDKEVYDALIRIWGKRPEKAEQVMAAYEVELKLNPDDQETRKKLALKYDDQIRFLRRNITKDSTPEEILAVDEKTIQMQMRAARELEILCQNEQYKTPAVEKSLVQALQALWNWEKEHGTYESKVAAYKRLQQYDPQAGEAELHILDYREKVAKLDPKNVEARTSLTLTLFQQGVADLARVEFEAIKKEHPDHPSVKRVWKAYAADDVRRVQSLFGQNKFDEAMAEAQASIRRYPEFRDVQEECQRIANMAQVEKAKLVKQEKDVALKYKDLGDQYFTQAEQYLTNLSNQELVQTRVRSESNEAIRYFRMAVMQYDQALLRAASLDEVERQAVTERRQTAINRLAKLTDTTPRQIYKRKNPR
jgi:tetratricopeptide (TPR) repeat protein